MTVKVCQLCAVDFTLQHFLLPLIDGMRTVGWEVKAVCSEGEYVGPLRERGYEITTVPIARSLNIFSHAVSFWLLWRLFRRERFNVLHVHTPVAALIGRLAGWMAGIPLIVYTAHGFYFHDNMPRWKYKFFVIIERLVGCFTNQLFTQSSEDAATAVTEGIVARRDVVAIGNGVDPNLFDPTRVLDAASAKSVLRIPPHATVIGIIGRMVREKGYREFLEAAELLASEFPEVYFLLVGGRLASDHDDPIELAVKHAKAVLGERLILTGYRADTPSVLAAMDVFCLPSYREGMPRTIIEAMMMGKPVIATNIRGSREEVVDGLTGILVPICDSKGLAAAMGHLLTNPVAAACMGEAGKKKALELYVESHVVAIQIAAIRGRLDTLGPGR